MYINQSSSSFNIRISNNSLSISNYIDNKQLLNMFESIEIDIKDFNLNKYCEWLTQLNFNGVNNPLSYFKTCFMNEMRNGTFRQKSKLCVDTFALLKAMRETEIEIINSDDIRIDTAMNYLYKNGILTATELLECNHKIIAYIKSNFHPATSQHFLHFLKKLKVLKGFDWTECEKMMGENIKTIKSIF